MFGASAGLFKGVFTHRHWPSSQLTGHIVVRLLPGQLRAPGNEVPSNKVEAALPFSDLVVFWWWWPTVTPAAAFWLQASQKSVQTPGEGAWTPPLLGGRSLSRCSRSRGMRSTVVATLGKYNLPQRTLADMHVTVREDRKHSRSAIELKRSYWWMRLGQGRKSRI